MGPVISGSFKSSLTKVEEPLSLAFSFEKGHCRRFIPIT